MIVNVELTKLKVYTEIDNVYRQFHFPDTANNRKALRDQIAKILDSHNATDSHIVLGKRTEHLPIMVTLNFLLLGAPITYSPNVKRKEL